ncbi:hypothetical protein [Luteimicrobium subarcticum]|uniref:Uncharacterized protein n=1 Tax=Luteimicrobium subarcticum TaxID=620910 RepID=A0A2M8WWD3_9MICO|nr:hypothetical protein [Luteimicrobium subarcticum]PJI95239.1 hypothetical protein CLV34_0002 [Luteimicrobium subarcticum]
MLEYRSYFTADGVADDAPFITTSLAQVHAWLRSKRYEADLVVSGRTVGIGPAVEAALTQERASDGSESALFRLEEKAGSGGTWTTQLLLHDPRHHGRLPWVWLDVVAPGGDVERRRWAAVPRLASSLLEVLDARDGGARLDPNITTTTVDDVESLVTALEDPHRRGPVFVAGSDESLPMQPWRQLIRKLLVQTTGLAAGYVLDPAATTAFAELTGGTHHVDAGTMRTYLPGVQLGDDFDARRHRVLHTATILQDDGKRIVRILGARARETTLDTPLPRAAVRVEERLLRQTDNELLGRPADALTRTTTPPPPRPIPHSVDQEAPTGRVGDSASTGDLAPVTSPVAAAENVETRLALASALERVLGSGAVTPDAVSALAEQALESARLRAVLARRESQLDTLTNTVIELRDQVEDLNHRLDDEQNEHGITAQDAREQTELVRALRLRLNRVAATEAWAPLSDTERESPVPESFGDLLSRFSELEHVVWTGDSGTTEELDERNPLGGWAGKTWDALRALDDYARERLAGRCTTFDAYLKDIPSGCHAYPANRHARDESDDVKHTAKYAAPRLFVVPASIDPSGRVFMGAHIKIAQSGMISPRMHYFDAVTTDGHIYVGYIGRHLPTQKTN